MLPIYVLFPSPLRNDMLVVQVVVVSSKSVPNSSICNLKLPCASKVALSRYSSFDAGFPANDNSIKFVTLLRRNQSDACPIPCLPDQGRSWRIAGYLLSVLQVRHSQGKFIDAMIKVFAKCSLIPCSRFSLVADTRRISTDISCEPIGRYFFSCRARSSCICTS